MLLTSYHAVCSTLLQIPVRPASLDADPSPPAHVEFTKGDFLPMVCRVRTCTLSRPHLVEFGKWDFVAMVSLGRTCTCLRLPEVCSQAVGVVGFRLERTKKC